MSEFDPARLAAVISPLRRTLLSAARAAEHLPEIPDAQIEICRALPRGVVRSPAELAQSLGLGRSTVSNLLTAMSQRGLVTHRRSTNDRRRVEVSATSRALDVFARFDAASTALVAAAAADLDESDRALLADAVPLLERLRDALEAQRLRDASPPQSRKEPK